MKGAIDHFLSHIVLPKAMKEVPYKLSASGWDLGAIKSHPMTGFSGTNDSRQILPLNVQYLGSEKQNHTNALMLAYLLQDENSLKLLPPQTDAEYLLKIIDTMELPIWVIIDAGAQILELSNIQETWLRMSNSNGTKAKAVIFFNNNEELSTLYRNGCIKLLQTSPFAEHLNKYLVYLDRKLIKGQSVIFFIPEEIQTKILECTSKSCSTEMEVSDLLAWALPETCADMRRNISLWHRRTSMVIEMPIRMPRNEEAVIR
jgi:hypothetical protein